jgi:hypothetical protein
MTPPLSIADCLTIASTALSIVGNIYTVSRMIQGKIKITRKLLIWIYISQGICFCSHINNSVYFYYDLDDFEIYSAVGWVAGILAVSASNPSACCFFAASF